MDTIKHDFIAGDTVYILTTQRIGVNFEIVKKTFVAYSNDYSRKRATLRDDSHTHHLIIHLLEIDSVFKTIEDAAIYAIIYFIETKEPNIIINKDIDLSEKYNKLEREHPDLILKYMDYVIIV